MKELKVRYYNKETLLCTIYSFYGNLIEIPYKQPSEGNCDMYGPNLSYNKKDPIRFAIYMYIHEQQ